MRWYTVETNRGAWRVQAYTHAEAVMHVAAWGVRVLAVSEDCGS